MMDSASCARRKQTADRQKHKHRKNLQERQRQRRKHKRTKISRHGHAKREKWNTVVARQNSTNTDKQPDRQTKGNTDTDIEIVIARFSVHATRGHCQVCKLGTVAPPRSVSQSSPAVPGRNMDSPHSRTEQTSTGCSKSLSACHFQENTYETSTNPSDCEDKHIHQARQ